jgi:hypothetical protein
MCFVRRCTIGVVGVEAVSCEMATVLLIVRESRLLCPASKPVATAEGPGPSTGRKPREGDRC